MKFGDNPSGYLNEIVGSTIHGWARIVTNFDEALTVSV